MPPVRPDLGPQSLASELQLLSEPTLVGLAPSPKFLLQELLALAFPTVSPLSASAVIQVHQPLGPSALGEGGLPAFGCGLCSERTASECKGGLWSQGRWPGRCPRPRAVLVWTLRLPHLQALSDLPGSRKQLSVVGQVH